MNDIRFALRQLRRRPAFTATILLTLALGIGANTAVFSVINAILLAPLPYRQADRLVEVFQTMRDRDEGVLDLSRRISACGSAIGASRTWPLSSATP